MEVGSSHSDDKQASQTGPSEPEKEYDIINPVVVTGFGEISDPPSKGTKCIDANKINEQNFSWLVVEKLSETISFQGKEIPVLKGMREPCSGDDDNNTSNPPQPVRVSYSSILSKDFQHWLNSARALVYVHLGITSAKENCIYLETTANRNVDFTSDADGEIPQVCISKSAAAANPVLRTKFDCSDLCDKLKQKFKSGITSQGSSAPVMLSFEVSDDAGYFLCNFLYYESLRLASKRESNLGLNVLFVHVPRKLHTTPQSVSESDKAEALAPVIEFIIQELLQQQAAKYHMQHASIDHS